MENNKNDAVVKFMLVLIIIFSMIIAGMIGIGITAFNAAKIGKQAVENEPARTEKSEDSGEFFGNIGDKDEEKAKNNESVSLDKTKVLSDSELDRAADLSDIVESFMPSVVAITSDSVKQVDTWFGRYSRNVKGAGSGVVFDKNEEKIYILTNNHVIADTKAFSVTFNDGESAEGKVRGTAAYSDIAVVEVKTSDLKKSTLESIKTAKLGSSDKLKVGQMVLAIGNALGYGQSLTVGYLSAKERAVTVEEITLKLIQTDAAINPGNSGGALINMDGELIGINSVKLTDKSVEGMGYAIPVDSIKGLVEELKTAEPVKENDRGYLGIYYREIDDATHSYFNMPYGLYISELAKDSGAAEAGIITGDIIVEVNGYECLKSEIISSIIVNKRKGDRVTVKVKRYENGEYKDREFEVTLGKKPKIKKNTENKSGEENRKRLVPSEPGDENNGYDGGDYNVPAEPNNPFDNDMDGFPFDEFDFPFETP